jgi:hypothetical protein
MTIIATPISIATYLTETTPEKSTTMTAAVIMGSRDIPNSSIREIIMHGFSLHTSN